MHKYEMQILLYFISPFQDLTLKQNQNQLLMNQKKSQFKLV